ncbi:MAG TPA: translation initiation factor IF-2 [Candidatus Faeciplasma gallinarum]|uniref:Translation initiation factor IF-2 n=1 Tax=Candidatus Faeciplasma gallinarum TaxID=2840799 RepID=A0A9D1EN45_9FIRM|nr:translation initiation factor IF-2 [Candidatus Faeciplasma gallinarum]
MITKYKLSDLARDLKLPANDIIDCLAGRYGAKKASAMLTPEEVNYVLEYYTQKNQVDSFDGYFAYRPGRSRQEQKRQSAHAENKNNDRRKNRQNAQNREAGASAAAQTQPKAEQPVSEPASQPEETKIPVPTVEPTAEATVETTDEATAETAENTEEQKASDEKKAPADESAEDRAAEHAEPTEPAEDKTPDVKPQEKPQENPVQNHGGKPHDGGARRDEKKHPAKKQDRGERVQLVTNSGGSEAYESSGKKKVVDTRGSYVDIDKYNDKYDTLADSKSKFGDNYQKKQKLVQKSKQQKKERLSTKRETEVEKMRRLELERARKQQLKVLIPDEITVSELAVKLKATAAEVIKKLIGLGVMATQNETIDFDTAALVAEEMGAKVEHEVVVTIEERLIVDDEDKPEDLVPRDPVVVVMGHVDHGKTSLLDRIRHANVTATEAGGITQHIGAYRVSVGGREITFLDTPGHEAFTAMRLRGAMVTDIAILVVAADDGIMPQTVEAINHAKAAGVSIIVAINKMDKEGANPDRIKQQLTEHELVPEEWGGDVICVPVSAKTGAGIDELLEDVILTADMLELKANPNRLAKGSVIEARLDKGRGPIATLLVQNGTLRMGDVIIAGTAVGRVRTMTDDKGRAVKSAGPSVPVEITGLAEVPSAGDTFNAVADEKLARELVEQRKQEAKEESFKQYQKVTLDNLFSQISEGEIKELPIIVKADVQGSVEAVKQSLEKISNDEVKVKVIHGGVGAISESDVMLANASGAIIVGFNVRPDPVAKENAERDGVDLRTYRVIYDAIEEIQDAMKGMLAPKYVETDTARVEVRQVYKVTGVGAVAGCYVVSGKISRNDLVRVVRDGIVISEDKMSSLKRFKDNVKEVAAGFECGITLEKFSDFKEGDIFEAYQVTETQR